MGVGTPQNILESVERGVDFFDCVYPARNGRHGHAYTNFGKMNLMNAKVSPKSAMSVVGLWSDANAVCEESKNFFGENWWKEEKQENNINNENMNKK